MQDVSDEAVERYKNQIEVLRWVLENHKAALSRLGKAVERGQREEMVQVWEQVKKYTEPLPT
jgi:tetrahydromethanopterin S-methyltransferase subunit A